MYIDYLFSDDHISVPPVMEGFRVEITGQTATFFWEPNLTYDNYTLEYILVLPIEYIDEAETSTQDEFDIPKAANSVTISNLAHSVLYIVTIRQNYEDLEGVVAGLFFTMGEYVFLYLVISVS